MSSTEKAPTAFSDVRTKELAILKASTLNQCEYCTTHDTQLGLSAGLTLEQVEALSGEDYMTSSLFSEVERTVIAWAHLVTTNEAKYDEQVFEQLSS